MKRIAWLISRVFDPVIIIPLILLATVSYAYLNGFRWRFITALFFIDAVLPGLFVFHRFYKKKGKDWDIHKREERLPLFLVTIVAHGLGVALAFILDRHPLAEILLGLWLMAIVYAVITYFWKISVHAGVNATLAVMVYVMTGWRYWWVWLIPLIVGWARVAEKHHTPVQVVLGMSIPPLFLIGYFTLINLFAPPF
jgi:hypothetical protein